MRARYENYTKIYVADQGNIKNKLIDQVQINKLDDNRFIQHFGPTLSGLINCSPARCS